MRPPNIVPDLVDTADAAAGTGSWREALPPEQLQLLVAISQGVLATGLLESLTNLIDDKHLCRESLVVQLDTIEVIGMDMEKSVRITEAAVESESIRTMYYPRRASHTQDGTAGWLDEDGLQVFLNGTAPFLPAAEARVSETNGLWQTWYAVPYLGNLDINAIETPTGDTLLGGIDFYRSEDRLIFREHPLMFTRTSSLTLLGWAAAPALAAYSVQQDGDQATQQVITQLCRHAVTPERLQVAACQLAGAFVMQEPDTIQSSAELDRGVRYRGLHREWIVPYDHPRLAVGTEVGVGYVFGDLVRLSWRGTQGQDWWRNLDWSGGLPLAGLCPVPGITMPSRPIRAVSYDDSGTIRINLFPEAMPANLIKYQTWCRNQERRQPGSQQLATYLGIEDPGVEVQVDGLALLFNALWGRRVIIADLRVSVPRRVEALLRQWCPTTAVLLIRRLPDLT